MEDQFSQVASLIGDPVRAKILWALLDKRAYTATELANYADTTPQNISMHLNKLVKADLLSVEIQGRHRYYNYSRADIPYAIEAIANLIPKQDSTPKDTFPADKPLRYCRSCYDHLAGEIGVQLMDHLINQKLIVKQNDEVEVTGAGAEWFLSQGIDVNQLRQQKRSFARPCLDWSERRNHLGGSLGAAMLSLMLGNNWMQRTPGSRAVTITKTGKQALLEHFKIDL